MGHDAVQRYLTTPVPLDMKKVCQERHEDDNYARFDCEHGCYVYIAKNILEENQRKYKVPKKQVREYELCKIKDCRSRGRMCIFIRVNKKRVEEPKNDGTPATFIPDISTLYYTLLEG